MARFRFFLLSLFLMIFSSLSAQTTVKGVLVDSLNKDKLFYVSVGIVTPDTLMRVVDAAFTEANGSFVITDVPAGSYLLKASLVGYDMLTRPITVPEGKNTVNLGTIGMKKSDPDYERIKAMGTDELDAVECYGGYGPHNPNHGGHYGVTTHFWGQDDTRPDWSREKLPGGSPNPAYRPLHGWIDAMAFGGGSAWSWTPHDYGVAITETDTVYYLDGFEVLRHPTGPVSLAQPAWFLIDYAIGGISGWPIDLERYGNQSDMWVDWVRVYSGLAQ